jgi:GntR family transcriptional regulator/MocR family aminotransferase
VLESDLDGEFQFDGPPLSPLAAEDRGGVVIYLSALSNFSPGLRLGFVHGPAPFLAGLRAARVALDRHGDPVLERAMAELVEDGELQRHLNKMRQAYRHRRDLLCGALRRELGQRVEVAAPSGGLSLWVKIEGGVDVDGWARRALEHGVAFQPGRQFAFDGAAVQGLRMGFSGADDGELIEAARRMRAALEAG